MKVVGIFLGLLFSYAAIAAPQYPVLSQVSGGAWVTGKEGARKKAANKQRLIEKATLETDENGTLKVSLDSKRSLLLEPGSLVILPAISWETGEAPLILLKKGRVEWSAPAGEKAPFNVAMHSDLFEFILAPGDFVFIYRPEKAYAGVEVYEGSMEFSAMHGDESVRVHAGEKAGFQGVFENGEIAYDILLKGRKIPRGHLTAVGKIDMKAFKADAAKKAAHKKASAAAAAAAADDNANGAICTKPAGRFNQCAWICEGNPPKEKKACRLDMEGVSCVRRRCNANGVWAEETPLDAEKTGKICQPQAVVGPCDY